MFIARIVVISVCLVIVGCRDSVASYQEEMYTLASAVTKLSSAIEATCRYRNPPKTVRDAELILLSTRRDPSLLYPFTGYSLRAKCEENHGVVLVCNKAATYALIEDFACTSRLDIHHWQRPNPLPCNFTAPVAAVCPIP